MRRIEVELRVVVRLEHLGEVHGSGMMNRIVTGETRLGRRVMLTPVLCLGMTLSNSGDDDTTPWEGFRVDSVATEASSGIVRVTMVVAGQDAQSYASVVREWQHKGWRCDFTHASFQG